MASLADMSRGELEELAASLGIENPEEYPNMGSLRDAITEAQGQKGADVAEDEDATQETAPEASAPAEDAGEAEVQARFDKEQEQGFVGRGVDPRPNTAYSLEGSAPEPGDNPEAPSIEQVKADPKLGDQYEGQPTYTEPSE